jgi:hypothetical protein
MHWPEAKLHYNIAAWVLGASRIDHLLSALAAIVKVDKETQPGALRCDLQLRGHVLWLPVNRTCEEAIAQANVLLKYAREGKAKWISKGLRFHKDADAIELVAYGWSSCILQGQFRTSFSSQNMPLEQLKEGAEYRIVQAPSLALLAAQSEGAMKSIHRGVRTCIQSMRMA